MELVCFADMQAHLFKNGRGPDLNEEADALDGCPLGSVEPLRLNVERVRSLLGDACPWSAGAVSDCSVPEWLSAGVLFHSSRFTTDGSDITIGPDSG